MENILNIIRSTSGNTPTEAMEVILVYGVNQII